ncbi:MAG: alpha/beta hydrolase [Desulfovibrio sp.]|nr:alpha/beta hydrolase [Desulfovibrio sp.]
MKILPRLLGSLAAALALTLPAASQAATAPAIPADADNFYKSDKLVMEKVTFPNLYKMEMAGDLFLPKDLDKSKKYPAIIVGHPMGAVKEQSAVLYAQKLAEQGFVTLAMDLAFWGASQGQPRNAVSPDMYAETFSAAVDFLDTLPYVDRERIGILGICGSGSFAISAAKIDPRLKALATVSMYDMGEANRSGLKHAQSVEQRKKILEAAARQRDVEFAGGEPVYTSGTVHRLTPESTPIEREFYDFYRTPRGEVTPPGMTDRTTTHPTLTSNVKFMNFYPFNDIETISPRPMLFITGEKAHSREFSEDAFRRAAEPKELVVVPGAGHVDLYDRTGLIPFAKLTEFFRTSLK